MLIWGKKNKRVSNNVPVVWSIGQSNKQMNKKLITTEIKYHTLCDSFVCYGHRVHSDNIIPVLWTTWLS